MEAALRNLTLEGVPTPTVSLRTVSLMLPKLGRVLDSISPFDLKASLVSTSFEDAALDAEVLAEVLEKKTGLGVPLFPVSIYGNNDSLSSGMTDRQGKYQDTVTIEKKQVKLRVVLGETGLPIQLPPSLPIVLPTYETDVLWDNFNDNELDKKVWNIFTIASPYSGIGKASEQNGRLEISCPNTGRGGGIWNEKPVDVTGKRISAALHSDYYEICALTVLPESEEMYSLPYNQGYNVFVWGIKNRFSINALGDYVLYGKDRAKDPDRVEIRFEDNLFKVLEEGVEVYQEENRLSSNICHIYLWGVSWYYLKGGTAWADNFLLV